MIRKKGKKKKRIVAAVLLGIVLYAAIMGIAFGMIRAAGKRSLRGNSETARPGMMPVKAGEELTQEEEQQWQEGWVKYQGNLYAYNEDILTFLFMGIDKDSGGGKSNGGNGWRKCRCFVPCSDESEKKDGSNHRHQPQYDGGCGYL